jgi:hypothetical protein
VAQIQRRSLRQLAADRSTDPGVDVVARPGLRLYDGRYELYNCAEAADFWICAAVVVHNIIHNIIQSDPA